MSGITVKALLQGIIDAVEGVSLPNTNTPEGKAHPGDTFRGVIGYEQIDGADRTFRIVPGIPVRNHITSSQREMRIDLLMVVYYSETETVWERVANDGILLIDTLSAWPSTQSEVHDLRLQPGIAQQGQNDGTLEAQIVMTAIWRWSGP